jgi:hypothetical protein
LLFLCDPFASVLRPIEEATVGLARCEDGIGVTRLTFVADIKFDELRRLARHVLEALRGQRDGLELQDPEDPLTEVKTYRDDPPEPVQVPKLNRDIWQQFVEGHGGDAQAAKVSLDRWMKSEADAARGGAKPKRVPSARRR